MEANAVLVLFMMVGTVTSLDNGVARTPPMGWLSWERYRCITDCAKYPDSCISENLYKAIADHLVEDGYRDAGYVYVNIDDCWSEKSRDANGTLVPDKKRFPSGMTYLADYMHSRGLKLGLYGDIGNLTCAGYPGSLEYYKEDAQTLSAWGVDSYKVDGCYMDPQIMDPYYRKLGDLLNQTGRPILYSCSLPDYQQSSGLQPDYKFIAGLCNIWRNYDDIEDTWESVRKIIQYYEDQREVLSTVSAPGSFNDPDMIIIGNFGLTLDQSKVQMAMWAIFAAPLLMSNDLRKIRPELKEVLLNREVIAINQDPLGLFGELLDKPNSFRVWSKRLVDKSYAVAVLNFEPAYPTYFTLDFSILDKIGEKCRVFSARDLFLQENVATDSRSVEVLVNPNGVVMLKLVPRC